MKITSILLLFFSYCVLIISCDRAKRKGEKYYYETKAKVKSAKDDMENKVFPIFDSETPDTKYNRLRFKEFFKFSPTEDVRDLYTHADLTGIDSDFQFSFKCSDSTVQRIVDSLSLAKSSQPDNMSRNLWHSYPWWDSLKIVSIAPYFSKGAHESYEYLWRDSVTESVYYFTYDL